jgi:ribonuclease-3
LVLRLIEPLMHDPERFGAAMDPKTSLQEIAAALGLTPTYQVAHSGPDHAREFTATVTVGDKATATGVGSSKKYAEIAAALEAWKLLNDQ